MGCTALKLVLTMIIACPACATRYVVPDTAIGVEGRTVRCAKCRHSWYQDGPTLQAPKAPPKAYRPSGAAPPAEAPPPTAPAAQTAAQAAAAPSPAPAAEPPPAAANVQAPPPPSAVITDPSVDGIDDPEPDFSEDAFSGSTEQSARASEQEFEQGFEGGLDADGYGEDTSHFDSEPPFKPRRNIIKYWTWAAGSFAALAVAAIIAIYSFGLPSWVPFERSLFASGEPDLEIQFPVDQQERRKLPDGTEYFGAKIIITNRARETRPVPSLLIVLRDGRERRVFDWEVIPPQKELAPGEVMTINEATTEIPRSAVYADIGWAPN